MKNNLEKWEKMTLKEVNDNPIAHQIINGIWHNGPIENAEQRIYRNNKNNKIKFKIKKIK